MSVSKSFNKSHAGQVLALAVELFGGTQDDFDRVVALALEKEILKPSKAKDPKDTSAPSEPKERGNSRWTAFQKAAKVRAVLEEIKLTRPLTKAIWEAYSEEQKKEWDKVAKELDKGEKILKISHPEINFLQPIPQAEEATEAPAEEAEEPKMTKEQLEAALAALD